MKAAIVGKDDEQFPGDVEDPTIQKASLTSPLQSLAPPAAHQPLAAQAALSPAKPSPTQPAPKTPDPPSTIKATASPSSSTTPPRSIPLVVKPALAPVPTAKRQQLDPAHSPSR